jgi:hypothetical protein
MAATTATSSWPFYHFGLIVTGTGERASLPSLFRSLAKSGRCSFSVIRQIGQRSPRTSRKRKLKMIGNGKLIPERDAQDIGFPARRFLLSTDDSFVVLVDDLEHARKPQAREVFQRYREALDTILGSERRRASVHFFANMLEAYYFADARAVNAVLDTNLSDHAGNVEEIRHPKNKMKGLKCGYRPTEHCNGIVGGLDVPHVLSNPETCAWLRALFAWCTKAMRQPATSLFRLDSGAYSVVTGPQMGDLP